MTDATKRKLSRWIPDAFVLDLLEASGVLYPSQVQAMSDEELTRVGLHSDELAAVREKLPVRKVESKAE